MEHVEETRRTHPETILAHHKQMVVHVCYAAGVL